MNDVKDIDIHQAKGLIQQGKITLVDIRDPSSFARGHITGATQLNSDNLSQFIATADLDQALLVYCHHGHASQNAAQLLFEQGFDKVYNLVGGYRAWQQAQAGR